MKKFLFLFLVIALASCNNVGNAPTIVDEKFDPPLDSLYIQCKDLKGLGELRICHFCVYMFSLLNPDLWM